MLLTYILFVVGFVVLILGANWLVNGSVSLGLRANLSPLVIGLTVVAFGTSLPELVINVFASFKGSSDLAIGNVLGSNIMNIFLILGISALLMPIHVERISMQRDIPVGLFATLLFGLVANGYFLGFELVINRFDGFVLLAVFGVYLWFTLKKGNGMEPDLDVENKQPASWPKTILLILIGLAGLFFGGEWVSDGALEVAKALGISETAVGLTIVAAATSLPELVTAIVAAMKKNIGIVMGNVLGSNIINILVVLGTSAIINPLIYQTKLNVELGMVIAANLALVVLIYLGKGFRLSRYEGISLILIYIVFIWFSINYN
ncbi:MAG TPA: calcium/sodium antiporter [Bacteroidales bacterium]|jgi:cation:H+ antiporter|nr:calcium/sodium antiporter [Bacteroidales bacterium]HPE43053.1 calcium/sodium antiporter [Bacteroidales bacterium]